MPHLNLRAWSRAVGATVGATVVAIVPMLAPAAAHADELRFSDSTHDVVTMDVGSDNWDLVPDPETRNADIKSVFVHYRKGHLVLRANFVELKRDPNAILDLGGEIRTNEHRYFEYDVMTSPRHYLGHDELYTRSGRRACEIGHLLDYRDNFARVSISLKCLSRPKWVQIRLEAASLTFTPKFLESGELEPGEVFLHLDDALSDTTDFTRWTPRVARG